MATQHRRTIARQRKEGSSRLSLGRAGHAASAAYLPLPPTIQCNGSGCTVENYQRIWADRKPCKAAQALYPTSEGELFQVVALASRTGSKVKVVGSSHSYSKLVCPGGDDGLIISTQHLNSLIHVNLSSLTVTAHAGVQLRDLIVRLAEFGLTLPHSPVWHGVSIAGMISTGAHGSGMWHRGGSPHDYVVGMRLIVPADEEEGFAKIIDLREQDADLNAARLSLGVLGAISQVTFQLEPMFKRSASLEIREDTQLDGDGIVDFAKGHEFGEICWYPFSGKALFKVSDRMDAGAVGDGAYNMAILDRLGVDFIESMRHGLEAAEESRSLSELCQEEKKTMKLRQSSGDGLVNFGNTFIGYPVVGLNHKMQTSGGCEKEEELPPIVTPTRIDFNPSHEHQTDTENDFVDQVVHSPPQTDKLETCLWNPTIKYGFFFFHTAISIPISRAADAIAEIKRLRDLNPESMCSLAYSGGIWIRFLAASEAYLAVPTESIMFEFMYYRARDPFTPRLHQDLFEEIEQILVNKYGGKPHWGKNRNLAFGNMHTRTVHVAKFLDVRQRFDPSSLFSNEWTDAILGIKSSSPQDVQTFQDHCALEGLCVCKEDSHCHPARGYFCRPGLAYKDARVCRYEKPESSNLPLLSFRGIA
ncbi:hypothetical protein GOP47_0015678 [Adiantum capillus-veneris]|uniref:FAD-binding PCMH-type domain-containing protein n=1 Tax=Adiantum capillus-veneris TaxID=13818 RepID=A0A9D4UKG5_ADICA|nr:hypothetical protein GOP47_0015678 [Adiantum capillus-veneris]